MFAVLKYQSIDYLYESIARQKFSIGRLSLCLPPCLQQDEKCHLTELCVEDKYRKPWTRVTGTQTMITVSVLDQWKKRTSVEDFLEKKPIFSVEFHDNNELVEVIPSSNTSSQIDKEELFSLTKNVLKEESTQDKYLKIDYATEFKKQCQDLCMEEEFIFVDSLENLRKKLPSSCVLLSRLQFFLVKDPLLDSKGQNLTEDNIFRACLTFQKEMKTEESKKELQEIKENFCTIYVKDEEYFTLPFELGFGKTSNSRSDSVKVPSYVELKGLLNLAPETMADEDMCKEMIKADLKAEITYKLEISKYCPIPQEICCSSSRSMLEFCESVNYLSYLKDEMELPLTPLDRQQKARVNSLCAGLKEEPIPLASNSILITEPSMEYLEFLVWQSEKYEDKTNSLLFVEHQTVKLAYQHCSLTELMEILPVEVEEPKLSSLEEGWWFHLGLNPVSTETLEQLSIAVSNTNNLLPTVVETFTQFTSYQLKRWLEDGNSMANQELLSAEVHQADKVIHPRTALKIQRQNLPMNAASSAKNDSTDKSVEELTGGTIIKNKLEEAVYFLSQENKTSKSSESVNCKDMFSKQDNSDSSLKAASFVLATKWDSDGSDLNNFIILRSKQTLTLREAKNNVDIPEKDWGLLHEEHRMHAHKEDSSVCETLRTEEEEPENEDSVTVSVQASESHCQAYCLLEEATTPVLTDLTNLSVLASVNWSFDSIKFDHTRFFLKQQEKVICDHFKEGKVDEKDIMLFRYAALVHLLVTVRDLLLTCGLDTALGYLSKAKDIYKSVLEPCLNNVWRQFMIVQYSSQKKHETNSKIMELQRQILKRMQSYGKEQNFKVLIITRMDSEREKTALIHTLSGVQGLKAMDLNSKKKGTLLGCKDVISNLSRYSCIIVHNQQIGADFPWAHFSLVMEYDYSENSCWKKLCKNLNVTYMTFKTAIPETSQMWDHRGSFLLAVEIPYVFLTTEGLLNTPDSLQLLESKYSITFVERSSSYSLKLFGSADRYVVLTIDECTAVFLQSLEELNCENSCDNVTSKLMALSLQYTCCWIVFYSRERLSSEYGLRGDTLLNLVTIYATLIELTQKSEDFDVKVLLTPGIDETGVVIRLIADNILIASSVSPHEWLDRSWLSVLPSEAEKFLLTFPCINPLAAQCMLKKGSSLNSLLFASFNQLQELLPEVPEKILKHFSDMTSSCSQNAAARLEASVKGSSPPENQNSFCQDYTQNHQSLLLLSKVQNTTGTSHRNSETSVSPLNHQQGFFDPNLPSCVQKKSCSSAVVTRRKQNFFAMLKDCEDSSHSDAKNSLSVQRQPFRMHSSSDQSSRNYEKEDLFASFSDCTPQEGSKSFLEGVRDTTFKSPEILIDQTPWNDLSNTGPCDSFAPDGFLSDFFVDPDEFQSLNFHQIGIEAKGKRKKPPPLLWTTENTRTGSGFVELKKRKLTYEKVPGRSDGQTRLKFF